MDKVFNCYGSPNEGERVGCEILAKKVREIKPKIHAFGHIHSSVGEFKWEETQYINCACLGENYQPNGKEIKVWEI